MRVKKYLGKILISTFGALMLMNGCVRSGTGTSDYWQNLSQEEIRSADVGEGEKLFVFYRANDDQDPRRINVFVNERYQSTLHQQTLSSVEVCAGENIVSIAYDTGQSFAHPKESIRFLINEKDKIYVRLSGGQWQPKIEIVDEIVAQQDIQQLKEMPKTLSRVPAPNCH